MEPDVFLAEGADVVAAMYRGEAGYTKPLNSTSIALEASRVVKSGPGILFGFSGFNNNAAARFIQVFDSQTLPADGAVPVVVLSAALTANFALSFGTWGRAFRQGIILCNSTTLATKTIGAADSWFDCQYA